MIAVTDSGWYEFLRQRSGLEEVNFWKPSPRRALRAAEFSPFLFKLRSPHNAICGFGFFARYSRLPDWLAWDCFGEGNGCESLAALRRRLESIRARIQYRETDGPKVIGCVLLVQPTFFDRDSWIAQPSDWPPPTQSSVRYDLSRGEGLRVWQECLARAPLPAASAVEVREPGPGYGAGQIVAPRLGQGAFRVVVTEAYGRACSVSGEHSLPALDAAHIRPSSMAGPHAVENGLLLRADLHRLFDQGYVTVSPEHKIEVSRRLRVDYENGRSYYPLHGQELLLPKARSDWPSRAHLEWHNEAVFLG